MKDAERKAGVPSEAITQNGERIPIKRASETPEEFALRRQEAEYGGPLKSETREPGPLVSRMNQD